MSNPKVLYDYHVFEHLFKMELIKFLERIMPKRKRIKHNHCGSKIFDTLKFITKDIGSNDQWEIIRVLSECKKEKIQLRFIQNKMINEEQDDYYIILGFDYIPKSRELDIGVLKSKNENGEDCRNGFFRILFPGGVKKLYEIMKKE